MEEYILHRNDLCWCGSGLKYKRCHLEFDEKIDGNSAPELEQLLKQEMPSKIKSHLDSIKWKNSEDSAAWEVKA